MPFEVLQLLPVGRNWSFDAPQILHGQILASRCSLADASAANVSCPKQACHQGQGYRKIQPWDVQTHELWIGLEDWSLRGLVPYCESSSTPINDPDRETCLRILWKSIILWSFAHNMISNSTAKISCSKVIKIYRLPYHYKPTTPPLTHTGAKIYTVFHQVLNICE